MKMAQSKFRIFRSVVLLSLFLSVSGWAVEPQTLFNFPLTSGRTDHIAALLPNSKVLIAGGFNTSDTSPSTELFDPAAVVPTPALLSQPAKLETGAIQFTFRNTPGLSFAVLRTTNLALPVNNWANVGNATEVSPGHYQVTNATPASPQRFYGVRSL